MSDSTKMNTISSVGTNNRRLNIRYTDDGFPIRTVHFSFEHQHLTFEEIETYFKSVGEVVCWEFRRSCLKPVLSSGYVQYQQPEHAAEVLSRSPCNIDGVFLRVEVADTGHQPKVAYAPTYSTTHSTDNTFDDYGTQTASVKYNGIPVLNLNDDCLLEIFGYLNVLDLTSVAEVCPRFQEIAQEQFSIKHKIFNYGELYKAAKEVHVNVIKTQVWKCFLKHFGPIIVNLSISYDYIAKTTIAANQALDLITNYCSETLNVLELDGFSLKGQIVQKMRPLFAGLQKLYLIDCGFDDRFVRMLKCCQRLTKLSIFDSLTNDYRLLKFNLPELKTISFDSCDDLSNKQLKTFLKENPQLEKVTIYECVRINVDILPVIARHTKLVKNLFFVGYDDVSAPFTRNAMHLAQLQSLTKLRLDCLGKKAAPIFSKMASAKVPLEFLALTCCKASRKLISSICELKTLNTVHLLLIDALKPYDLHELCEKLPVLEKLIVLDMPESFNTADLIKLAQNAKKLQELHFWCPGSFQIDEESFQTLIGIIKERPDSLPLKISVPVKSTLLDNVSNELVIANRHKLIIDTKIFHPDNYCQFYNPADYYDGEMEDDDDDDDMGLYGSDFDFTSIEDSDDELIELFAYLFHNN